MSEMDAVDGPTSPLEEAAARASPSLPSSPSDDSADAKGFNIAGYNSHVSKGLGGDAKHYDDPFQFSTLTGKDDDRYDLSEGARLAIVLNHEHFDPSRGLPARRGTEADCVAIRDTFRNLGFAVNIYDDKTHDQIMALVARLQENREEMACLALFIMTHGEDNGVLHAYDKPYRLDKHIIAELLPSRCPSLAGKPKLLFVQACQGKSADSGSEVRVRSRHTSHDGVAMGSSYRIPHYADLLVFQAAYHGHYSFRSGSGSWFVQALCKVLEDSGEGEDIAKVLIKVKRYVSLYKESNVPGNEDQDRKKQIPLVQDTLIRDLYLKRGLLDEGGRMKKKALVQGSGLDMRDHQKLPDTPSKKKEDKCKIM